VVEVGLSKKAKHALHLCCGEQSDALFAECFEIKPDPRRLYNIRNSINHGTIDVNDLAALLWVESRFLPLYELVMRMLQGALRLAGTPTAPPHQSSSTERRTRTLWERAAARWRKLRYQRFTRQRRLPK
jgi:hypothetical protein